jgi:hypothetical protein
MQPSIQPITAPEGTRRQAIWDPIRRRKITGAAAPMAQNLAEYLRKRPSFEPYCGQDMLGEPPRASRPPRVSRQPRATCPLGVSTAEKLAAIEAACLAFGVPTDGGAIRVHVEAVAPDRLTQTRRRSREDLDRASQLYASGISIVADRRIVSGVLSLLALDWFPDAVPTIEVDSLLLRAPELDLLLTNSKNWKTSLLVSEVSDLPTGRRLRLDVLLRAAAERLVPAPQVAPASAKPPAKPPAKPQHPPDHIGSRLMPVYDAIFRLQDDQTGHQVPTPAVGFTVPAGLPALCLVAPAERAPPVLCHDSPPH